MVDGRIDIESNVPSVLPRVGAAFESLGKNLRAFASENNVSPLHALSEALDRDLAAIRLKTEQGLKASRNQVQNAALQTQLSGAGPASFQNPGGVTFGASASAQVREAAQEAEALAKKYAEAFGSAVPEAGQIGRDAALTTIRQLETVARNLRESLAEVARRTDLPKGSVGSVNLARSIEAVERRLQDLDRVAREAAAVPTTKRGLFSWIQREDQPAPPEPKPAPPKPAPPAAANEAVVQAASGASPAAVQAMSHWLDLNCMQAAAYEVNKRGGELRYGWAQGPEGRAQHVWAQRDGQIIDPLNWTGHEDMGRRDMPGADDLRELRRYVRDHPDRPREPAPVPPRAEAAPPSDVEAAIRALNAAGAGGAGKPPPPAPPTPAAPPPPDGRRGDGSLSGISAEVQAAADEEAAELRRLARHTRDLEAAENRLEFTLEEIAAEIRSKNFNARAIGNNIVSAPGLVSPAEREFGSFFKRFEAEYNEKGEVSKPAGYYQMTDPDVQAVLRDRAPYVRGRTPEDRAYGQQESRDRSAEFAVQRANGSARDLGGGYGQLNDGTFLKRDAAGQRELRTLEEVQDAEARLARQLLLESNSLRLGRGIREGVFSRGFGANGLPQGGGLPGLGQISENFGIGIGNALKYGAIYAGISQITHALSDTKKEFLDYNDSIVDVNVALGHGAQISTDYVLSLQNITRVAGSNVGEALDVAARGIRAFGKAGDEASSGSNQIIGADVADAASQLAVIANKPLKDAAGDVIAIGSAFGLAAQNLQQVNDAIASAKQLGGDPSNISQGLANFAVPAKEAGFSLNQAAAALSLVIARTDESGATAATRLSRITAIFGTGGNQAFLRQQGVDTTKSVREQIQQLAVAYQDASASEQAAIRSRLGGTANLRELLPLLDANNQALLANADANAKAGEGQSEFDRRANALAGTLKKITGDITAIQINLVNTDIFAPLLLGVRAMEPVLHILGDLLGLYDRLPGPLKTVIALTAEYLLLQRGLRALSAAGGFGGAVNGGVQRVREIGNPALAAQNRAARDAAAGATDGAAAARAEAEAAEVAVIDTATTERATAEAASVTSMRLSQAEWARTLPTINTATTGRAAAEGAQVTAILDATQLRLTAEDEQVTTILDVTALRTAAEDEQVTAIIDVTALRTAAENEQVTAIIDVSALRAAAETQQVEVIQAASVERAAVEAASLGQMRVGDALRNGSGGLRRGLNNAAPGNLGEDVSRESLRTLRGSAANIGRQIGQFANSFAGMLTLGLVAGQIINSAVQVGRRINRTLQESSDALSEALNYNDSASATKIAGDLRTAAAKDRQSSEGIIGSIVNFTRGDATGREAKAAEQRAGALDLFGKRLDAINQKAASGADLASAIDVSSSEGISNGLKLIADEGGNATDQFDALILALQRVGAAAGGAAVKLTPIQQQKFSLNLGQSIGDSLSNERGILLGLDSPTKVASQAVDRFTHPLAGTKIGKLLGHLPGFITGNYGENDPTDNQKAADAIGKLDLSKVSIDASKIAHDFQAAGGDVTNKEDRKVLRDQLAQGLAKDLATVPPKAREEILDGFAANIAQALHPLTDVKDPKASLNDLLQQGIPVALASGARQGLLARTNGDERGSGLAAAEGSRDSLNELKTNVQRAQAAAEISPEEAAFQLHFINDKILEADAAVADATVAHIGALGEVITSVLSPFDKTGRDMVALSTLEEQLKTPGLDDDARQRIIGQINDAKNTIKADQLAADNAQKFSGTVDKDGYIRGGVDPRDKVAQAQATLDAAGAALARADQFGVDGQQTTDYSDKLTAFRQAAFALIEANVTEANAVRDALVPVGDKVGELMAQAQDQLDLAAIQIQGSSADLAARRQAAQLQQQARETQIHIDASVGRLNIDPRDEIALAGANIDEERRVRDNLPAADVGGRADADFKIAQDELAKRRLEVGRVASQRTADTSARSPVATAATNLQNATDALALELPGTTAYFDRLAAFHQAQDAVAAAALAAASTRRKLGIDLTDPVAAAQEALKTAQDQLTADANQPADVQETDRLAVIQAQTALEAAQFQKNFNAITVADQLGRVTHNTYLNYLQSEHNRLTAITQRTYQQQQELDQVDQAIKAANESLQGQFNLGDIKVPSVYEVRRSIAQDQIGAASNTSQSNVNTTNSVVINGADLVQVKNLLIGLLGTDATSRRAVTAGRKL